MYIKTTDSIGTTVTEQRNKQAQRFSDTHRAIGVILKQSNKMTTNERIVDHTISDNSNYLWYVATIALKEHLQKDKGVEVETWIDTFDIPKILNIIENGPQSADDLDYLYTYFYVKYAIKVTSNGISTVYDLRTALTDHDQVGKNWTFKFSVKETHRRTQQIIVTHCIGNKKGNIRRVVFSGVIDNSDITACPIHKSGTVTPNGSMNHIDNYITKLKTAYYQDFVV